MVRNLWPAGKTPACLTAGLPAETWHPTSATEHEEAKRVCAGCPVRKECLAFALKVEPATISNRHGIWGGLDPAERQREYEQQHENIRRNNNDENEDTA